MAACTTLLSSVAAARRPIAAPSSGRIATRAIGSSTKALPTGRVTLARLQQQSSRPSLRCRAENGEGQPPQQPAQSEAAPASSSSSEAPAPPRPVDPQVAKGQRTAIITGAISIIFGVIYLALVSFLDMRGGEMLPPPPEAFENL